MSKELVKVGHFPSEMVSMMDLVPKYYAEELSGLSPLTLKVRRTDLKKFFEFFQSMYGGLDARLWYPRDSRLFIDFLQRDGYAATYANRNLASIKSFGHWLWHSRYIDHDPVKGIREIHLDPPTPQALDEREWHRFQKAADLLIAKPRSKHSQDFRNKVIAITLEASGLRIEELLSLRLDQLVGNRLINVAAKGRKIRAAVTIKRGVSEMMRDYINNWRIDGSDYLFTNRYGGRLSRNGVAQALNRIALVAGSAFSEGEKIKIHPHKFRHTHAKRLYDATHDPLLVARRLGHGSGTKYVGRYATTSDQEIDDVLDQI